MAPQFQGSQLGRWGRVGTKHEQVVICRDQVSLQSTSRQSFCYTDLAEPGDAHRFGTEITRGEDFNAPLVVQQFLRKHRQTHSHAHAYAHARACVHACELELVHVSLNSLSLFVVAEGCCFLHNMFLAVPFLLSLFFPQTIHEKCRLSTFTKTAVTSALDCINLRSTLYQVHVVLLCVSLHLLPPNTCKGNTILSILVFLLGLDWPWNFDEF